VQRFVQDCAHVSEHARLSDAQRARAAAAKATWLAGEVKPSGGPEARELLKVKATLVSKDDPTLLAELDARVTHGQDAKRAFLQQTSVARGCMLHTAFPPAGWPLERNGEYADEASMPGTPAHNAPEVAEV
jgi:hypothetical protein